MNRGVNHSAERVLALLREHNEGRTVPEITKALGMPESSVRTVLTTLSRSHPVSNEGTNYFLVDRWAL